MQTTVQDAAELICPSCKVRPARESARAARLHPQLLTNGLACRMCERCHGMLVDIGTYSQWSAQHKHHAEHEDGQAQPELDDAQVRISGWQALTLTSPLAPTGHGAAPPPQGAKPHADDAIQVGDSAHALVCPSCQRLMLRYRVAELGIGLDFCFACTQVWLDNGEWAMLAQHGLHLKITQISTAYWQRNQQKHRLQAQREADLREALGDDTFDQVIQVQNWLTQHPQRESILRFLRSEPPEA